LGGERGGRRVREGVGEWGRNDPTLYAHMNKKKIQQSKKKKTKK
jgi:hypothetical protein